MRDQCKDREAGSTIYAHHLLSDPVVVFASYTFLGDETHISCDNLPALFLEEPHAQVAVEAIKGGSLKCPFHVGFDDDNRRFSIEPRRRWLDKRQFHS